MALGRAFGVALLAAALAMGGCSPASAGAGAKASEPASTEDAAERAEVVEPTAEEPEPAVPGEPAAPTSDELFAALDVAQDFRDEFDHGPKDAEHQRYIVLHDTEGTSAPEDTVAWWASNGNLVAAHFVVGVDGHIVQCVPLDRIAHHAGFGDTGHNDAFGIVEDGRDDRLGTVPIGASYADYALNAWSIGIEMVHVGGSGDYPAAQLEAVDALIAYLDASYAEQGVNPSMITDHKAWRSHNSDTSAEFAGYLANYQDHRTHD